MASKYLDAASSYFPYSKALFPASFNLAISGWGSVFV
jgi:hypothetical protein